MEIIDPQEQRIRQHNPLAFKDIKQLKEAVVAYGVHAPFTVTLLESFAELNLTPSDWMHLCRSCISGEIICYGGVKCRKIAKRLHGIMPLWVPPA